MRKPTISPTIIDEIRIIGINSLYWLFEPKKRYGIHQIDDTKNTPVPIFELSLTEMRPLLFFLNLIILTTEKKTGIKLKAKL